MLHMLLPPQVSLLVSGGFLEGYMLLLVEAFA